MLNNKPIKLSDYIEYPFLIPNIYLDFNIGRYEVIVDSSMIIKPKAKEYSKLILCGNKIKLLSISINDRQLTSKEYSLSNNELVISSLVKNTRNLLTGPTYRTSTFIRPHFFS